MALHEELTHHLDTVKVMLDEIAVTAPKARAFQEKIEEN